MRQLNRYMYDYCHRDETVNFEKHLSGFWCHTDDVEELEVKCAELEASHGELLAVAKDILGWREGVFSAIHPRASLPLRAFSICVLASLFDRLRAAIAKAEGEVMP